VPALFKAMTVQAGLDFDVSLATTTGAGLDYHYNNKHSIVVRPYDIVLLQGHSMLDASRPGHAGTLIRYAGLLAAAFHAQNPDVDVRLMATWSRADQAYRAAGSLWFGQPVWRMALDVRAGCDAADDASDLISGVIPVGEAWNRAIAQGLADPNPYDGIGAGQVNLWAPDGHHASVYGYYLAALTIFGDVTKRDPRTLGAGDQVARDLGISAAAASALQGVAAAQLQASIEPGRIGPDISPRQRDLFEAALIANDQAVP
jgi:hypothetical protein